MRFRNTLYMCTIFTGRLNSITVTGLLFRHDRHRMQITCMTYDVAERSFFFFPSTLFNKEMKKWGSGKSYNFTNHHQNLLWQPVNSVRTSLSDTASRRIPEDPNPRPESTSTDKAKGCVGELSINFRTLGTISDDSLMRQGSTPSTNLDCLQWKRNVRKWGQSGKRKVDSVVSGEKVVNSTLGACVSSSRTSILQWHFSREAKGTFIGRTGLRLEAAQRKQGLSI